VNATTRIIDFTATRNSKYSLLNENTQDMSISAIGSILRAVSRKVTNGEKQKACNQHQEDILCDSTEQSSVASNVKYGQTSLMKVYSILQKGLYA
jgi:hypothetical protein